MPDAAPVARAASEDAAPYAFVEDIAASWQDYKELAAALADPVPPGLVVHIAGPTDEGIRVIELWETKQAWARCRSDRLGRGISAPGRAPRPQGAFRPLHPAQIVFGKTPVPGSTQQGDKK